MYVIKNAVHLFGDLPLSIVMNSGFLEYIDEYFLDKKLKRICLKNENVMELPAVAVCVLQRKDFDKKEFFLTEKDIEMSGGKRSSDGSWKFMRKGLLSTTWEKYPKQHWKYRVRSVGLKDIFPDVLKGRRIFEYDAYDSDEEKVEQVEKKVEKMLENLHN